MNATIHIATVSDKTMPVGALRTVTWDQLKAPLTRHKLGPKEGTGWLPAYIEPGPRVKERVQHISALVLDIEGPAEKVRGTDDTKRLTGDPAPPVSEVADRLQALGWAGLVVTSWSHEAPAEQGTLGPRYRVTMPVSRPVLPHELKLLQEHAAALLGLCDCVDRNAFDLNRLFYSPRVPKERQHLAESREVEGQPLDVDVLLAQARAENEAAQQAKVIDAPAALRPAQTRDSTHTSVISAFNAQADAGTILESHGYVPRGRNRWVWPGSTTGEPGVVLLPNSRRVYSHHGQDPLHSDEKHSHDCFSVWCILQHGGDVRQAVREAARMLGMLHQPTSAAQDFGPAHSLAWPELDPLPDLESLQKPAEAFPMEALGPIAGPAAASIARMVQAPAAIAAGSVLSALALAAQALADVWLPHGATSPLSLFIITGADSGDRKSRSDSIACMPIEEFRRAQDRLHKRMLALVRDFKGPKDERPEPPKAQSLSVSKATVEGLTKQLLLQSHVGLFSPDGADVLGGHSMQADRRAAGIAWFLRAWSGETLDNLTAGNGLMVVSGRRLTMHLLVQPIVLQTLMIDPLAQGQGLVARCLIACPESLAGSRMFKLPTAEDEQRISALHQRIGEMLALPLPTHPDGDGLELKPRRMALDEQATALWIAFHDEVERRQGPHMDLAGVRPWASKAAEQAARIAAILAVVDGSSVVQAGHMVCGMKVAAFYLGEHVRLMGVSADMEHAKRLHALLDFLQKRGNSVPHKDVLQHAPRSVRSLKAEGIAPLLDELTQRGYIRKAGSAWEVRR